MNLFSRLYKLLLHRNQLHPLCFVAILALTMACSEKQNNFAPSFSDESVIPTIKTINSNVIESDSGVPRLRIIAAEWLMFQKGLNPRSEFPKGFYAEHFKEGFEVDGFVKSDSAIYYNTEDLWQLDGHVEFKSLEGKRLTTSQLFWDRKKRKFRTDRLFRIDEGDGKFLYGRGMTCNDDLTGYNISKPGPGTPGVNFAAQKQDTLSADTLTQVDTPVQADSAQAIKK